MVRRYLVISCKRTFFVFLMICLGCSAQLAPTELAQRIERQLRVSYNVPASVKVVISPPRASEFPNYDALTVTFDGDGKTQNLEFLLSKDQKTLLRMTKMDLTKDPYAEKMKKIDVRGRPVRGNANAKVVVVNYDDFQCPFCSKVHQTLFPELLKEYGDRVAFIYKDFPLAEIHPWATHAAVDANCLAAQNGDAYWDFADYIHANQHEVSNEKTPAARLEALDKLTVLQGQKHNVDVAKLEACIKTQDESVVKASMKQAESVGVEATPTLFISGEKMDGAQTIAEMRLALDRALKDANLPVPEHPAAPAPASK